MTEFMDLGNGGASLKRSRSDQETTDGRDAKKTNLEQKTNLAEQTNFATPPAFDLHVAVEMARFAFDAYNTPDISLGYTQMNITGCETLYISKEFLNERYAGRLTVKVVEGSNLPDVDFLGKSDPYVVIESADGFNKTKVIRENTNPVWNQTLYLLIPSPSDAVLKVAARDTNFKSSDKKLGEGTIMLNDCCDGQNHRIPLELTGENGGGILTLEVQYQSFEDIEKKKPQTTPIELLSQEEKTKIRNLFLAILGKSEVSTTEFENGYVSGSQFPETKTQETKIESKKEIADLKATLEEAGWETSGRNSSSAVSSTGETNTQSITDGVNSDGEEENFHIVVNLTAGSVTGTEKIAANSRRTLQPAASISISKGTESLVASYDDGGATEKKKKMEPIMEEEETKLKEIFATAGSAAEAWSLLASYLNKGSIPTCEKVCFVQNGDTDTQATIWRDRTKRLLVVAFRGTEKGSLQDVITDVDALPTWDEGSLVHTGFAKAINSIKDHLFYLIENVLKSESSQPREDRWQLWFTGHSLGAALATLFAKKWAESPLGKSGKYDIKMYNFGSPQVGHQSFVDQYKAVVADSWRVVNLRDIVPVLPKITGYKHIPPPYYVKVKSKQGPNSEEEQKEDKQLAEYLYGDSHVFQHFWQTVVAITSIIKDGSATSMHMENHYYLALLQEVKKQLATKQEE